MNIINFAPARKQQVYNFQQNSITNYQKYPNLSPLKSDSVSFTKKVSTKDTTDSDDIKDSATLEWIDDKKVRELAKKALKENYCLQKDEIVTILNYFNISFKRNTGDDQYAHEYIKARESKITIQAANKDIDNGYSNRIKAALKVINLTNGELYLLKNQIPSKEEIAAFVNNETVKNTPDEFKNPYRLKLEEYQKRKSLQGAAEIQQPKTSIPTNFYTKELETQRCDQKEYITFYQNEALEEIDSLEYVDEKEKENFKSKIKKETKATLQELKNKITAFKETQYSSYEELEEKYDTCEKDISNVGNAYEETINEILQTSYILDDSGEIVSSNISSTKKAQERLADFKEKAKRPYSDSIKEIQNEVDSLNEKIQTSCTSKIKVIKEKLQNLQDADYKEAKEINNEISALKRELYKETQILQNSLELSLLELKILENRANEFNNTAKEESNVSSQVLKTQEAEKRKYLKTTFAKNIISTATENISTTYQIANKEMVRNLLLNQFTQEELNDLNTQNLDIVKTKIKQMLNTDEFKKLQVSILLNSLNKELKNKKAEEQKQAKIEERKVQKQQIARARHIQNFLINYSQNPSRGKSAQKSAGNMMLEIRKNEEKEAIGEIKIRFLKKD